MKLRLVILPHGSHDAIDGFDFRHVDRAITLSVLVFVGHSRIAHPRHLFSRNSLISTKPCVLCSHLYQESMYDRIERPGWRPQARVLRLSL
jgi:hypothetical protein